MNAARRRRPSAFREGGFTLLEVLVAMAIIAFALAAALKTAGTGAANTAYLSDKTFAHWVAMNQLAELQTADSPPGTGTRDGEEEMADTVWYWTAEIEDTAVQGVRRIDLSVRLIDDEDAPALAQLVGFIDTAGSRTGRLPISPGTGQPPGTRQPSGAGQQDEIL